MPEIPRTRAQITAGGSQSQTPPDSQKESNSKSVELCRDSGKLREQTHDEKCYIESGINQPIDYALLVDGDNPNRHSISRNPQHQPGGVVD